MKIDDHPMEIRAMDLFKEGKNEEAEALQAEFLNEVKQKVKDHCPCPEPCRLHGKCAQCIIVHRGHGDHLPYCFHEMLNRRIQNMSGLSEHSVKIPPEEE